MDCPFFQACRIPCRGSLPSHWVPWNVQTCWPWQVLLPTPLTWGSLYLRSLRAPHGAPGWCCVLSNSRSALCLKVDKFSFNVIVKGYFHFLVQSVCNKNAISLAGHAQGPHVIFSRLQLVSKSPKKTPLHIFLAATVCSLPEVCKGSVWGIWLNIAVDMCKRYADLSWGN